MKKLGIMLVAVFLVTLVFSAMACGGGGGEATPIPTNTPAATQSPKGTETPGNTATPAAITLVSPDKLGKFCPAAPPGWQQIGVQSQKDRISGHDVIVAHNYYWPAGSSLAEADGVTISLYDYGAYYPSGHMPEAQQATVHGYPAWKLVQPETPSANLEVAINNRFKVDITCKYEDVLDQFSDLIDYAGIAALK